MLAEIREARRLSPLLPAAAMDVDPRDDVGVLAHPRVVVLRGAVVPG